MIAFDMIDYSYIFVSETDKSYVVWDFLVFSQRKKKRR